MELLKGRCVTGSVGPGRDRAEPERSGQPFLEAPERLDGVNLVDLNLFRGEGDHVPDDRADKGGKHGRDQPSEHLDASPQTIRPVTSLRVVRGWLGRAVMAIRSRPVGGFGSQGASHHGNSRSPDYYPGNQDPHKSLQPIRSSNSRSRLPRDQRSTTESTEIHGKENPNQLPLSVSFPGATPARRVGSFRGYAFVMIFLAWVITSSARPGRFHDRPRPVHDLLFQWRDRRFRVIQPQVKPGT